MATANYDAALGWTPAGEHALIAAFSALDAAIASEDDYYGLSEEAD